jgi:hypothetical protein
MENCYQSEELSTQASAIGDLHEGESWWQCALEDRLLRKRLPRNSTQAYPKLSDMVRRDDLDAVLIASPNYLHAQQTIVALESGKHVLCTKPTAMSLTEADSMIAQSHKSRTLLEICFQYRYDPRIYKRKQMTKDYWAESSTSSIACQYIAVQEAFCQRMPPTT